VKKLKFLKQVEAIKCDVCLKEIETDQESYTFDDNNQYHECKECSFITGKIDEMTYLKWVGEHSRGTYAGVKDGKVVIWSHSKTPPWERKRRKR
jgi:hypothetical protein